MAADWRPYSNLCSGRFGALWLESLADGGLQRIAPDWMPSGNLCSMVRPVALDWRPDRNLCSLLAVARKFGSLWQRMAACGKGLEALNNPLLDAGLLVGRVWRAVAA